MGINYCSICENHTLCKFKVAGQSDSCRRYDNSVFISKIDITNIVDRINEKRNVIATGLIKRLPQAANMRKMYWSEELAKSAQRWADQCHPMPELEDDCRDLEHTTVSQCISSIYGPTSGFNVKSFVDSWFMTSMIYSGSVSYYNESIDYHSRYFSQLIWASTYEVGCGRSKYYINNGLTPIDKLVCNFAPSGNIHGKPVYSIGFPATQCQLGTSPDNIFRALCAEEKMSKDAVTNIWSIITTTVQNDNNNMRHQKIRHIWPNDNADNDRKSLTTRNPYLRNSFYFNNPGTPIRSNQQKHKVYFNQNIQKCTRNQSPSSHTIQIKYSAIPTTYCSRKFKSSNLEYNRKSQTSHIKCTRRNRASQTKCNCNTTLKCQCLFGSEATNAPKYLFSHELFDNVMNHRKDYNRQTVFYNTPPIIARSTFSDSSKVYFKPKIYVTDYENLQPFKVNLANKDLFKSVPPPNDSTRTKRQYHEGKIDYFWRDEMSLKKQQNLKPLRYTTLGKNKNRILTMPIKKETQQGSTEKITINLADTPVANFEYKHKIPEKYLSFEELLTQRKNNKEIINEDSRRNIGRQGAETTTESESSSLFSKVNHCSRKVTCTWTAPSNNSSRPNRGSRTPPGYVEGCTRTSTCTREFLERNKFPSSDIETTIEEHDEDYCEKRSAKVIRSNLRHTKHIMKSHINLSTKPMSAITRLPDLNKFKKYENEDITTDSIKNPLECIC